jgi:hypothetical protein
MDITPEQRAAWKRWSSTLSGADRHLIASMLPDELTDPVVVPTKPGWYLVPHSMSPSGATPIELLKTGEWVDSTDSQYLSEEWVAERESFTPLYRGGEWPGDRDWLGKLIGTASVRGEVIGVGIRGELPLLVRSFDDLGGNVILTNPTALGLAERAQ